MRLLVTGATGFLGRYVVGEALRRGHDVRAVVRPSSRVAEAPELDHPRVEIARVDLRSKHGLVEMCAAADAVLHLAAVKSGDMYAQYAGTVVTTENLLEAMMRAGEPRRIIGVSSFAVYDYLHKPSRTMLDEESALEPEFPPRDEYSHTKLVQERLIREHAQRQNWDYAILRPGVIYGRDNLWTARLGISANERLWLRIGWLATLPLSYVENCAEAIVLAAERAGPLALTVNVIDDELPTQASYAREVLRRLTPRPRSTTLPWPMMCLLARSAWATNRVVFKGRARLPAILVPARLHARFKPLRYSNGRLHEALGWRPRYSLTEALERSLRP
jgi:nucleoside-diphosphate-sugar epimerase